jgi:hypothetical protein
VIKLSMVRDAAVSAACLALAAVAAEELGAFPRQLPRPGEIPLAGTRHGWLCTGDGTRGGQARRLRPATAAEAEASAASRAAGDGGWFGLTLTGEIVPVGDPRFTAYAGRGWADDHVEAVFVATPGGTPAPPPAPPAGEDSDTTGSPGAAPAAPAGGTIPGATAS